MTARGVGIPWFRREQYDAFRELLPNRDWHDSYDDWLHAAEQLEQSARDAGSPVYRIDVTPDSFTAWCQTVSHLDANPSLAQFAATAARKLDAERAKSKVRANARKRRR